MRRQARQSVLRQTRSPGLSRLAIVATVTQPAAIRAILECVGLPARPPPMAAAREPEQPELDFHEA